MLSKYRHNIASAASASEEHTNLFLMSVLRPWLGAMAPVPDGRLRGTILKTTHANTTETSTASNLYMFVLPFASPRRNIRVYAWDSALQRFNYLKAIEQDEDLAQSFKQLRLVSAGLRLKSSTVTGNTFTVSGNVNGITYYDPPDLQRLTHETLVAYKRDNAGAVAGVAVSDGVVALAVPDADHIYDLPRVKDLFFNDTQLVTTHELQSVVGQPLATRTIFISDSAGIGGSGKLVPPNPWGRQQAKVYVVCTITAAPAATFAIQVDVQAVTATADPATHISVMTPITLAVDKKVIPAGYTGTVTFNLDGIIDSEAEVARMAILASSSVPGVNAAFDTSVRMIYSDIERDNIQGPGSVLTVKGMNAGQQLSIDGIFNYEVVPDAQLARNVPTSFVGSISPVELEVAHTLLANASSAGIRFILPAAEYEAQEANGFYDAIAAKERSTAHAASLGSVAAKIARFLKPVARAGILAGADAAVAGLTPYLGPAAVPMGMLASTAINKAFASSEGDTFPPGTMGYAASVQHDAQGSSPTKVNLDEEVSNPRTPPTPGEEDPENGVADWSDCEFEPIPISFSNVIERADGQVGQAASVGIVPSLAEVMTEAPLAATPASAPGPLSGHSPISAFMFDRSNAPNTPALLDYIRSGDARPLQEFYAKLGGVFGHRSRMVVTVTDSAGRPAALPPWDLYVTDRPVARADPKDPLPQYVQGQGPFENVFFDRAFSEIPRVADVMELRPLAVALAKGKPLFVTASLLRGLSAIGGNSWHAAFYAAICMAPYGAVFTGSLEGNATNLNQKVGAVAKIRPLSQLIMLNPNMPELDALEAEAQKYGIAVRRANPFAAVSGFPLVFATSQLPALLAQAVTALTRGVSAFEATEKVEAKQKALAQAQLYHPDLLQTKQKVMVGGVEVEIDAAGIDPDEYLKLPSAKEALVRVSPGSTPESIIHKWKEMLKAKPVMYGSLARKWAAVESARRALLPKEPKAAPAPGAEGGMSKAQKRREKEKKKKQKILTSLGRPAGEAPAPAAALAPDAPMGGLGVLGAKRPRGGLEDF